MFAEVEYLKRLNQSNSEHAKTLTDLNSAYDKIESLENQRSAILQLIGAWVDAIKQPGVPLPLKKVILILLDQIMCTFGK